MPKRSMLSLPSSFVCKISSSYGLLVARNRQQRGIKLHEGGVDRAVGLMAGIAVGGAGDHRGRCALVPETVKGPAAARLVFQMHFRLCDLGLELPTLVDRAVGFAAPHFEHENRFVGPSAGF